MYLSDMNLHPVNLYCCKVSQLLIKETLQCATQSMPFKPLQERRSSLYDSSLLSSRLRYVTSTVPSSCSFAAVQNYFRRASKRFWRRYRIGTLPCDVM